MAAGAARQDLHGAPVHDVAIVGLGAMGSAAALELARRGADVIGFDRHTPPHTLGSSHGGSRIIREAYFESPVYVPMVQRAFELWRALERASGTPLLQPTGGLMIGAPDSVLVEGALRSAREHGLLHEVLSATEIRARYPVLNPEDDMVAVWEPRAGVLAPEACVTAQLDQARAHGAALRFDEPVVGWDVQAGGVRVVTAHGVVHAKRLVISAGAWTASLLPGMQVPLAIERQVQHWFEPLSHADAFTPQRLPIHLWQFDGGRFFYGFPDMGAGIKMSFHHRGEETTADTVQREVSTQEVDEVRRAVQRFVPAAAGRVRASSVCLYTNTPDEHFWIDRHPSQADVIVASPCSGHGFKFAPVVGEIVADLVEGKPPRFDVSGFRWR